MEGVPRPDRRLFGRVFPGGGRPLPGIRVNLVSFHPSDLSSVYLNHHGPGYRSVSGFMRRIYQVSDFVVQIPKGWVRRYRSDMRLLYDTP